MSINMIAAIGKNNELGKDNKLIWHLHEDMNFFKEKTKGKYVVMGRKTFESLPGSLPGRTMIVLSHQQLDDKYDVICFNNPLTIIDCFSDKELFIIGGQTIYEQFMPFADTMFLTEINDFDYEADTYFPQINEKEWNINEIKSGTENNIDYKINKYVRKKVKW